MSDATTPNQHDEWWRLIVAPHISAKWNALKVIRLRRDLAAVTKERDELRKDKVRLDRAGYWMDGRTIRFIGQHTMDGKYPAWSVYSPSRGRILLPCNEYTLRQAIDAALDGEEEKP